MVFAYQDKKDSDKMKLWTSEAFSTDIHPHTLYTKLLWGFFYPRYNWSYLGGIIKTDYDAQDAVTSDKTKIVKTVYSYKSILLHNLVAFTQISLTEKKTDA